MDRSTKQAFLSEIANLIRSAEHWYAELERAITKGPENDPNGFEWQLQELLKAFLVSVCGIARILDPHPRSNDPSYASRKRRGAELRAGLNVSLDSRLFATDIRDSLEHLDERIDDWIDRHPGEGLQTWRIYNVGQPVQLPGKALREFDVPSRTLRIGRDEATVGSIIQAVQRLKEEIPKTHRLDVMLTLPPGAPPTVDLQVRQVPGTGDKNQ